LPCVGCPMMELFQAPTANQRCSCERVRLTNRVYAGLFCGGSLGLGRQARGTRASTRQRVAPATQRVQPMSINLFVHLRVAASALTLLFLHAPARVPMFWERLATCETGHIGAAGDGRPRWDWGAHHRHLEGTTFEGGVGFYSGTWSLWAGELGLLRLYPHAYLAPPAVQVRVAEYGFAHGGYWGCNR
jgi:hypothetical protein